MRSERAAHTLKGITWAHARGYAPLAATAQAFVDIHPDIDIRWDRRSLAEFGEGPLEQLVDDYDLIVFDHPFTGLAAERGLFVPLDARLDARVLDQLREASVGCSYRSYQYGGHQWGLPIDGACQVAVSRQDLMARAGIPIPTSWAEVLTLARDTRAVAVPLTRQSALGAFFTLCAGQGAEPCHGLQVVEPEVGFWALEQLKAIYATIDSSCLEMSPIAVLNVMASSDDIAYVPLSYSYSNYARAGYAPRVLAFHDIPAHGESSPRGATLGGAGIAISARSRHTAEALEYVTWVAGGECQASLYVLSGGQPAHRAAWEDELANRITNDFFRHTRRTLEQGFLRPNYAGFPAFQRKAGAVVQDFLAGGRTPRESWETLNALYTASTKSEEPAS